MIVRRHRIVAHGLFEERVYDHDRLVETRRYLQRPATFLAEDVTVYRMGLGDQGNRIRSIHGEKVA